jgi:hypothetical protein
MTVADGRTARVRVDYSQYQVAAGAEMTVGDDGVPGLLRDMGGQAVAVLTGLQSGVITVTAHAVATDVDGLLRPTARRRGIRRHATA